VPKPEDIPDVLSRAMEAQLGLKLELRKTAIEMLVVDHAEKEPVENRKIAENVNNFQSFWAQYRHRQRRFGGWTGCPRERCSRPSPLPDGV
jgi:hypothetical protein